MNVDDVPFIFSVEPVSGAGASSFELSTWLPVLQHYKTRTFIVLDKVIVVRHIDFCVNCNVFFDRILRILAFFPTKDRHGFPSLGSRLTRDISCLSPKS